ncbi:MAG: HAMP domain-containing histidine kinase [Melioribacteraceae bacterium]|nr:HAMP domain-containing histidine kinase [Melioribacteraceae bacterium]
MKRFMNQIGIKLIGIIILTLIILLAAEIFFTSWQLRKDLIQTIGQSTYNFSEVIKNSLRMSMTYNDDERLAVMIDHISEEPGIQLINIIDKKGLVQHTSDLSMLNQEIDINSNLCSPCHDNSVTLESLSLNDRIQIEDMANEQKSIILVNPIENHESCWSAPCHAHTKDERILGILEVMMSTEHIDKIVNDTLKSVILNTVGSTVIIAVLIGLFISAFVNKPLNEIKTGIDQLASGNLEHKIEVTSSDEFQKLASQFNRMSERILIAQNEIKSLNEHLEEKVEQKTEELKSVYNQIIQIEKLASLGKLSSSVAHELNNPLEGILTYSKLIQKKLYKKENPEQYKSIIEFLELISDESARCGKIVKDLLLFSHRGDEAFVEFNLLDTLKRSITLINHHLEMNNIKLEKEIPEEEKIPINGNSQKIQQALISLFMNAIEAVGKDGHIRISLSIENKNATIRVIDNGSGIPKNDIEHIFEPFYSTKSIGKGTGLGLSIAYGIIANHKGTIRVEETSARGTSMKLSLPLNKIEVENVT